MLPSIKQASVIDKRNSLAILVRGVKNIPADVLSKEEKDFVEKEFDEKRNTVIVNQYQRLVIIHRLDEQKAENTMLETCRKAGDQIASAINKQKKKRLTVLDEVNNKNAALALTEGVVLGNYQFLKYRKEAEKEANTLEEIGVRSKKVSDQKLNNLRIVCDAVYKARDLVNEPQSAQTARELAQAFVKMGHEAGFKTEVFNKSKIKALKMGGILAVNQGSEEPPTFTVMEWNPRNAKNKKPYILVGKGVVYDTGGLSLKPTPNSMDYMKCDMGGAAVVGCAIYAIAKAKLPVHVIALAPSTDNRLSENAYAPGDVVKMMSGQTVEVLNTDAEGRMILADALHYAKQYKPELVMDFATLTGAAAAAVGSFGIVTMGTADDKVKNKLKESGEVVYERLAEFPFWDEYDELIKSDIADMKNIGGPAAGAITAGKFLQRFIDYPWMHFDIAGPAFLQTASSYRGKGGTGIGVRFLFNFFEKI